MQARPTSEQALKRTLDDLHSTLEYLLRDKPRQLEAARQRYYAFHRDLRRRITRASAI